MLPCFSRLFAGLLFCGSLAPAAEVTLHKWSGDLNVPDPVAVSVDPQGRVYVAATTRRKVGDLDIREHPMWIPDDVSLTSVEEKSAFLKRELAPGKMRSPRGGLKDHNKDGSIDWKDLTVHTERIYQLWDTDGDGTADKMTVFAEGFNTEVTGIAAGILYHDGWVYATIAPDLWRLKDTDDDGVADVREIVAHGFGIHIAYAGHDMHGPRLGPDGRIYWSIGDKGVNATSKEGKRWYYPSQGCVMRVEPDGTGFEVFAHGLRNVQEVAFDDFGNMFGVDNDADLPGERERFVYITERSDSGWRCGHQYMKSDSRWMREAIWQPQKPWLPGMAPTQPLFVTPPLANYSNGPAGFAHEPGTVMGAGLRGQFILDQFPSGQMDAFAIEPDGTAFKMTKLRTLNKGIMGIGLAWGPDGGMYMADWMGGYPLDGKGAVWRVDDPTGAGSTERKETQALLTEGFAKRAVNDLQILLGHPDQRVRLGAQLELAKKEKWDLLLEAASDPKAPLLARIHGVWGYGIGLRHGRAKPEALEGLVTDSDEPEVVTQVLKVLGDAPSAKSLAAKMAPLLTHRSPRLRFQCAIALGKLEEPSAEKALLKMAAKEAADPWQRHAVVTGLAGCVTSERLAAQATAKDPHVRLCCALALARRQSPLIAGFLADADPAIVNEAASAIHDDEGVPAALPELAALAVVKSSPSLAGPGIQTMRRALNANLRLGRPEHAARLLAIAMNAQAGPQMQEEALQALLVFTDPPRLDRVDGMAHSLAARDTAAVAAVVQPRVQDLLALGDPQLKADAIQLMVNLSLKVAAPGLLQMIADAHAKPPVRVNALRLMGAQHADEPAFTSAVNSAVGKSAPEELRLEALAQIFVHQPENAAEEAARVLENGSLAEKQAAFKHLTGVKSKTQAMASLLTEWAERLANGKVDPALKLDVMEAVPAATNAAAKAAHDELLEGGSVSAGREIVTNHLGANCLACHTVELPEGSEVGPNLKLIGAQRDRAYLLESLINPGAKIAPGYGLISIRLKNGADVAGSLAKEEPGAVSVKLADGALKEVQRDQIATQTPPVSVMPPMLGILTPREVRDVVAYLSSLKGKPSKKDKDKSKVKIKQTETETRPAKTE